MGAKQNLELDQNGVSEITPGHQMWDGPNCIRKIPSLHWNISTTEYLADSVALQMQGVMLGLLLHHNWHHALSARIPYTTWFIHFVSIVINITSSIIIIIIIIIMMIIIMITIIIDFVVILAVVVVAFIILIISIVIDIISNSSSTIIVVIVVILLLPFLSWLLSMSSSFSFLL